MNRILVADDDPNVLKLLNVVLSQNGYTVISAVNGLEALEKIKSEKPDLAILDVMMPGLDGFHVAFELKLKEDIAIPDIRFIMLTARAGAPDLELGKKLGAFAYLTKPFDTEELLSVVARSLKNE